MEIERFHIETIHLLCSHATLDTHFRWHVQKERNIWIGFLGRNVIELLDEVDTKSADNTLIHHGRVACAVHENYFTDLEAWEHNFAVELGASRLEQQHFGGIGNTDILSGQHHFTNLLENSCSTRLAQRNHVHATGIESITQTLNLNGLARSFSTFK